jgi:hypothetical protein
MITSADLERILVEVITGKDMAGPDNQERAVARKKLMIEVKEIRDRGGIVEIPPEIPDLRT